MSRAKRRGSLPLGQDFLTIVHMIQTKSSWDIDFSLHMRGLDRLASTSQRVLSSLSAPKEWSSTSKSMGLGVEVIQVFQQQQENTQMSTILWCSLVSCYHSTVIVWYRGTYQCRHGIPASRIKDKTEIGSMPRPKLPNFETLNVGTSLKRGWFSFHSSHGIIRWRPDPLELEMVIR